MRSVQIAVTLQFEEERKMPLISNIERMAIEKDTQQGIQQGIAVDSGQWTVNFIQPSLCSMKAGKSIKLTGLGKGRVQIQAIEKS